MVGLFFVEDVLIVDVHVEAVDDRENMEFPNGSSLLLRRENIDAVIEEEEDVLLIAVGVL